MIMNYSIPVTMQIVSQSAIDIITGASAENSTGMRIRKRLRALWSAGGTDYDLGTIAGFSGRTSFSGTHASLTLAWPAEKNPRSSSSWNSLLVPDDAVRIKLFVIMRLPDGDLELPLLTGVPSPNGITESYGTKRETLEIRIEDVTGVAMRDSDYTVPYISTGSVSATFVADSVLPVPYVCLYPTVGVSGCVERFPNALAAADDALITQQDKLNPLTGQKRVRYGDRDGRIVYRLVEESETTPFNNSYPDSDSDFAYAEQSLASGLSVEPLYTRLALSRINPYLDLGSIISATLGRAGIGEQLQVREINWRLMPRLERMTIKGRREPAQ